MVVLPEGGVAVRTGAAEAGHDVKDEVRALSGDLEESTLVSTWLISDVSSARSGTPLTTGTYRKVQSSAARVVPDAQLHRPLGGDDVEERPYGLHLVQLQDAGSIVGREPLGTTGAEAETADGSPGATAVLVPPTGGVPDGGGAVPHPDSAAARRHEPVRVGDLHAAMDSPRASSLTSMNTLSSSHAFRHSGALFLMRPGPRLA